MIDLSPFAKTLAGKPVAVFGLARSGLSSVRALLAAGVKVFAWDDKPEARAKAEALGAEVTPLEPVLKDCACLVLAPGVPLHFPAPHPVVVAARAAGVEVICDIEMFYRARPAGTKIVGVTGTNGKSTTVALLGHVLNACGVRACVGGNIGTPVLDLEAADIYVLELSSYQLDLCPSLAVDVAVLLNITPDHIDRHGSMENYAASKRRIFNGAGVKIEFPAIDDRVRGCANMKGDHNLQNASAALLACEALGLSAAPVIDAIKTFPGLAHRQFLVREIGGVSYINDSKATNGEAAGKALAAYEDIYWIAGGQAKEGGLDGLDEFMPRVKKAFLIGEAAQAFSVWIEKRNVAYEISGTLAAATLAAHEAAQKSGKGVVLLSPACASFDQFTSFEDRGHQFTEMVEGLAP